MWELLVFIDQLLSSDDLGLLKGTTTIALPSDEIFSVAERILS